MWSVWASQLQGLPRSSHMHCLCRRPRVEAGSGEMLEGRKASQVPGAAGETWCGGAAQLHESQDPSEEG